MLNKNLKYLPIRNPDGTIGEFDKCIFLKHFITKTDIIEVGDYTYYSTAGDNLADPTEFENRNVLYGYPGAKLKIGKFCQLAHGCKFIMPFANHHINSFTTYPLFWNLIEKYDN